MPRSGAASGRLPSVTDRDPPPEPEPLRGIWRVLAPAWLVAVVLLYLAVRELGLRVAP